MFLNYLSILKLGYFSFCCLALLVYLEVFITGVIFKYVLFNILWVVILFLWWYHLKLSFKFSVVQSIYFSLVAGAFSVISRNHCMTQGHQHLLLCLFTRSVCFSSYKIVYDPFELIFAKGINLWLRLFMLVYLFVFGCPIIPALFVLKNYHFFIYFLCSFVKDPLTIFVFWALYFVPLMYLSILSPIPHCYDFRSF